MTRRAGLTSTEVLVSLFIMAIGVIAILTLFPLGYLNMGQAMRDDRVAQSSVIADGYMRWYWKSYVVENQSDPAFTGATNAFEAGGGVLPDEASYPVFVDPIGIEAQGAPGFIGNATNIPRRSLNLISSGGNRASMAIRTCTLTDGITYGMNGTADTNSGVVERDNRYNWAWVLQRPVNRFPTTVTMQVVVFERRAPRYFSPNTSEQVFPNATFPAAVVMNPTTTSLTLPLASGVQKGGWILDATVSGSLRHANFYRVSSATDNGAGQMVVELETAIRRTDGQSGGYNGTIVVLAGVVDVFTKPSLTP